MANISQFVFFDTSSTEQTSNVFGNISQGSALTLQVDDFGGGITLNLEVEGAADMLSPDSYYKIKVINLETFKTTSKITSAGLYMVIISGVSYIRMKSNQPVGNFKAFAVSVS